MRSSWSSGSTARVSSGAKPYSSKVAPQPVEHVLLDHALRRRPLGEPAQRGDSTHRAHLPISLRWATSHVFVAGLAPSITSTQVRVGRALAADGGRRPVAGQDHRRRRPAAGSCPAGWPASAPCDPPGRSVRPIEPAKSTSPERQQLARRSRTASSGAGQPEQHRAAGVAGRVVDGELQPGHRDRAAVGQLAPRRRARRRAAGRRTAGVRSHGETLGRVGQQLPVARVDVGGDRRARRRPARPRRCDPGDRG